MKSGLSRCPIVTVSHPAPSVCIGAELSGCVSGKQLWPASAANVAPGHTQSAAMLYNRAIAAHAEAE